MHKLIIIIEAPENPISFEDAWPAFLHQAEKMPGLIREVTVRVSNILFGNDQIYMIHELFFETQAELQTAMTSPQGQISGHILQRITGGRMTLITAEHREDDIENILKYQVEETDVNPN